jgi:hypothetical protein
MQPAQQILETSVPAPAVPIAFGVGSVMSRTFSVWTRNVVAFTSVGLVLHSPAILATIVLGAPSPGESGSTAMVRGLTNVLSALLSLVVTGALTFGVLQSLAGRPVRLGEILSVGFRRAWPILVVSLGVGLFVVLGGLLLVIPAFIAITALWLAVPASVAEPGIGAGAALRRSRALTKGHRLSIFLVFVLFALVGLASGALALLVLRAPAAFSPTVLLVLSQLVSVMVGTLGAAAPAVAYHDLRLAKEGVDTAQLAAVFE